MFQIGDKLLCINSAKQPHTIEELSQDCPNFVVKGKLYTARGFTSNKGIVGGVWLEEIYNPPKYFKLVDEVKEPAFALWRFVKSEKVAEKKEIEQENLIEA